MIPQKVLNAAVVGLGGMGITHIGAYMLDERVHVTAVSDVDKQRLQRIAEGEWPKVNYYEGDFTPLYKIQKTYADYADLAADGDIDIVSVCTPNKFHHPIVRAMLEASKDVVVEKPMALNYQEARDLVEFAHKKGRLLAVGQVWRFHPHVQYAKAIIEAGLLGDIVKLKGYGIHEDWVPTEGWFIDPNLAGGGALIDMGIHPIDTIRFLLEGIPVTKVYARVKTAYGNYKVDDVGVVHLEFSNGALAIVEFGWGNPHKDGVESSVQIFGTRGYMRVFPTVIKYTLSGVKGSFSPDLPKQHLSKDLYVSEISHIVTSVVNKRPCIVSGDNVLETMKVVDAAYRSSKEKRIVELKEYDL